MIDHVFTEKQIIKYGNKYIPLKFILTYQFINDTIIDYFSEEIIKDDQLFSEYSNLVNSIITHNKKMITHYRFTLDIIIENFQYINYNPSHSLCKTQQKEQSKILERLIALELVNIDILNNIHKDYCIYLSKEFIIQYKNYLPALKIMSNALLNEFELFDILVDNSQESLNLNLNLILEHKLVSLEFLEQYNHLFNENHWKLILKHQWISSDFADKYFQIRSLIYFQLPEKLILNHLDTIYEMCKKDRATTNLFLIYQKCSPVVEYYLMTKYENNKIEYLHKLKNIDN